MWRFEFRTTRGEWRVLFISPERTKAAALKDARAYVGGYMAIREWRAVKV